MAAILGIHNTFLRSIIIINNKASFKKCVNQEYMHVLMKGSDLSGAQGVRAPSRPKKVCFLINYVKVWPLN